MRYFLLIFCFLSTPVTYALSLKDDSPKRYVVQRGDSLWSISNRYLKNPWEWKTLWRANPHIKNPKRLYPGAILVLSSYHNAPFLRVLSNGTIKLSPHARPTDLEEAVPPIPLGDIRPFLNESLVLDEDVLSHAPYVVAFVGEHMLADQGVEVYVKGLHPSKELPTGGTLTYSIFREGRNFLDPVTKKIIGYKATLVGNGDLTAGGDPATVLITNIYSAVRKQDKVLINNSPEFDLYFQPETPSTTVSGFIIDLPVGMPSSNSQSAAGGVTVISIGAQNGLKAGDVLGIFKRERFVKDPKNLLTPIKLPPERIGEAMVFRTFTKTSFALIVRSIRPVYLNDIVSNP